MFENGVIFDIIPDEFAEELLEESQIKEVEKRFVYLCDGQSTVTTILAKIMKDKEDVKTIVKEQLKILGQ